MYNTLLIRRGNKITVTHGWWVSVKRRHPEIALRVPELLTNVLALCSTCDVVEKYFDLLGNTPLSNDLYEKPCQFFFNCDEAKLPPNPHPPKVVVPKGIKHPIAISSGEHSQVTVLACCSAGGYVIPPFVIFDRKTLKPEMATGEVPCTMIVFHRMGGWTLNFLNSGFFINFWHTLHHLTTYRWAFNPLSAERDQSSR